MNSTQLQPADALCPRCGTRQPPFTPTPDHPGWMACSASLKITIFSGATMSAVSNAPSHGNDSRSQESARVVSRPTDSPPGTCWPTSGSGTSAAYRTRTSAFLRWAFRPTWRQIFATNRSWKEWVWRRPSPIVAVPPTVACPSLNEAGAVRRGACRSRVIRAKPSPRSSAGESRSFCRLVCGGSVGSFPSDHERS